MPSALGAEGLAECRMRPEDSGQIENGVWLSGLQTVSGHEADSSRTAKGPTLGDAE